MSYVPVLPQSAPIFTTRRRPFVAPLFPSFLLALLNQTQDQRPAPLPRVNRRVQGKSGQPYGGLPPAQLQIPVRHGGHCSPRCAIGGGGNETPVGGEAGVFSAAGEIHPQPLRFQRVPFEWTINPYRGCEFACKYATRVHPRIHGNRWRDFEKKIFMKQDAAALLARDVSQKYSYESKALGYTKAEHIAIGTATDPTSPRSVSMAVTRACLEELAKRDGLSNLRHHQVQPDCARHRHPEGHRLQIRFGDQHHGHDA